MTDKEPLEVTFEELAEVIRGKEESKLSFPDYVASLRVAADNAARKVELAEACINMCEQTKGRRPRKDKGQPRKRKGDSNETLV